MARKAARGSRSVEREDASGAFAAMSRRIVDTPPRAAAK
jgi:hypothetical protein